ncbi:MAG: alpha/beta fold hydrolase, partial [Myxococcota bacterium]
VTHLTLDTLYQSGNRKLLEEAKAKVRAERIEFDSQGDRVVGNLYVPSGPGPHPAVVVAGSWTTVKEQMAGTYARELAERGFVALAIDARGFGESEGSPRFYESPERKIADYKNAITFLDSLDQVDTQRIGALGVCAGAGYVARVAAEDTRVSAVGLVASWLHDREAVKLIYGGAEGVAEKIAAARKAKERYQKTGDVEYVPNISESDPAAAMFGPFEYYLDAERGALPEWGDKFAVMSWEDWLNFDPMPSAAKITVPVVMVHSDDAVLGDNAKRFFENVASPEKRLHWTRGGQFDFYDQPAQVDESVDELTTLFVEHL